MIYCDIWNTPHYSGTFLTCTFCRLRKNIQIVRFLTKSPERKRRSVQQGKTFRKQIFNIFVFFYTFYSYNITYDLRLLYSTLMMYSTKNIHFYYPYIWDLCSTFWEINHITVQGGVAPCYEAWLYMGSTICPGQKWELSFYTRPNHPNYPRIWAFFVKI